MLDLQISNSFTNNQFSLKTADRLYNFKSTHNLLNNHNDNCNGN